VITNNVIIYVINHTILKLLFVSMLLTYCYHFVNLIRVIAISNLYSNLSFFIFYKRHSQYDNVVFPGLYDWLINSKIIYISSCLIKVYLKGD
jgi:hypothetical protein